MFPMITMVMSYVSWLVLSSITAFTASLLIDLPVYCMSGSSRWGSCNFYSTKCSVNVLAICCTQVRSMIVTIVPTSGTDRFTHCQCPGLSSRTRVWQLHQSFQIKSVTRRILSFVQEKRVYRLALIHIQCPSVTTLLRSELLAGS